MEIILASRIIDSPRARNTFFVLVRLYEKKGKIDLTLAQLTLLCGIPRRELLAHLNILTRVGLIEKEKSNIRSIRITPKTAHRTIAFSLTDKQQHTLDKIGALPVHRQVPKSVKGAAREARRNILGEKGYRKAQTRRRQNKVKPDMLRKIRKAMLYYEKQKDKLYDRMRPINVKKDDNSRKFSTILPAGKHPTESSFFGTFKTIVEEAELQGLTPEKWIKAQFIAIASYSDDIPYPNQLIGEAALYRIREAQEMGYLSKDEDSMDE